METRLTVDPARRRKKHEERIRSHELEESITRDYLRRADFCGRRFVDGRNEPALFEHVDLFSVPRESTDWANRRRHHQGQQLWRHSGYLPAV
jgi:hypothetical protein